MRHPMDEYDEHTWHDWKDLTAEEEDQAYRFGPVSWVVIAAGFAAITAISLIAAVLLH